MEATEELIGKNGREKNEDERQELRQITKIWEKFKRNGERNRKNSKGKKNFSCLWKTPGTIKNNKAK